jgi:hypothetical protein
MLLYVRCYNCTWIRCKLVQSRRQPRTSLEETRCQSLQRVFSCEDSLIVRCTRIRCKLVQNRRQPRTSFEETWRQSLQRMFSCEDSLIVSYVIACLDLLQLRNRLGNIVTCYGCKRQIAYTRCFTPTIYDHALRFRRDLLSQLLYMKEAMRSRTSPTSHLSV